MKKKKAFKHDEVTQAAIPNFPELSVTKLYELFANDREVMAYLPDMSKKKCPKDFVWRILVTLRPSWTERVLADAER